MEKIRETIRRKASKIRKSFGRFKEDQTGRVAIFLYVAGGLVAILGFLCIFYACTGVNLLQNLLDALGG